MLELTPWYPQIKLLHLGLVLASGLLFAGRGAWILTGRSGAMQRHWRWLSYGIDTCLLAAGVALWAMLSIGLADNPWLATKLVLLVIYVVLGSLALKRARTPAVQRVSYAAALGVYLFMASVALAHHPLGALRWLTVHAG